MTLLPQPTPAQELVLAERSHLLVIGPPGTGKTTIALAKATAFVVSGKLLESQAVLFLSFSNAAVHRIREAAQGLVPREVLRRLEITTFHGLCHSILAGHRRLAGLEKLFQLLPPEDHTNLQSRLPATALEAELSRLEKKEGRVRFDRFPTLVAGVFTKHETIRDAYARAYPLILVDEYQDTSDDQEDVVRLLAEPGQVVYLGDPDQRIYDWVAGTRADRLSRLAASAGVVSVRLEVNHRNGDTDITSVADAILAGQARIPRAKHVHFVGFGNRASQITMLKRSIIRLEKYLKNNLPPGARSNIAIMARTNDYLAGLSAALLETDTTWEHPFRHHILLSPDAVAIAWDAVMALLEPARPAEEKAVEVLRAAARLDRLKLRSATRIRQAEKLERWATQLERGNLGSRATGALELLRRVRTLPARYSGDPAEDSRTIIQLLKDLSGSNFDQLAKVLELRPPVGGPGDLLAPLAEVWAANGAYTGARSVAETALLQERMEVGSYSASPRVLMTLHKCKGKQFDAVIIVDGHQGPTRLATSDVSEARRLLRVGLTRARYKAVVLTPAYDPCPLLPVLEG